MCVWGRRNIAHFCGLECGLPTVLLDCLARAWLAYPLARLFGSGVGCPCSSTLICFPRRTNPANGPKLSVLLWVAKRGRGCWGGCIGITGRETCLLAWGCVLLRIRRYLLNRRCRGVVEAHILSSSPAIDHPCSFVFSHLGHEVLRVVGQTRTKTEIKNETKLDQGA